jgi:hypothetical protein
MSLYNCHRTSIGYRMTKWDDDLDIESSYELSTIQGRVLCPCFQGGKPSCRHRDMLAAFIKYKTVDTDLFYDYDRRKWARPLKGT